MTHPDIEALMRDLPFIITEWSTDSRKDPKVTRLSRLSLAIGFALRAAADQQNARIYVTDDRGVQYAQMAMFWQVPEEYQ